jgi:amino acid adenylation domain-containing protein
VTPSSTASWTIPARPPGGPRRLSFPQERLFLLDRIMPGLPVYNVPTVVRVGTTLDADLLARAFDIVVARHDVLRTTIRLIDGVPLAEISPGGSVELTVCDLRSIPESERETRTEQFLAELARRPFDLARDVLLRAGLVHARPEEDVLLVVVHHAGSDHSSGSLLFSELDTAYEALSAGDEPELPVLPIQYPDFADWQRDRLRGEFLDELVEYWTGQLAGAPERLELPTDRPRPSAQSYRGRRREFTIAPALAEPLRELARRQGASPFIVLLAAFKTLIHRYTGASDLLVGVPVSGRHHVETAPLLGLFSNTLVLRSDFSDDPSFAELVERVKTTTRAAQAHQELPFEKLVEVLNPERSQSHSPLFQVFFGFDVASPHPPTLAGCELERLPVPGWEWARFDLSIVLRELRDGSLDVHLEYAADLFDDTTIERMTGHFETLLEAVGRDPEQRVSTLPILTARERSGLLVDWNATERSYDGRCVHELFAEHAALTPDALAAVSEHASLTYGELDRRSNQLARELSLIGVAPGSLVGICAERSAEVVVALLGVLKSGAAYVPIDPAFPSARQQDMLADAQVRVLLTQERLVGGIDPGEATVVCLDHDWERIAQHSDQPTAASRDPHALAYVIYTSGSTGQPKGVQISHRALVNFLTAMRDTPGLGSDDVLLAVTTLSFDIAGLELYLPLIAGAHVVITPDEATLDGVVLANWLARTRATVMQATPTTWQLLVDAGWAGDGRLKILCGGEPLPRALADRLLERGASVWQMYGPTETTVWSSVLQLEGGDGPPPLGGPIANTSFYVLDGARQPVPIGVPGELYIGGDGVATGYHNRPELTAERFLPDPFAPRRGPMYRTGDLVRWHGDGTLEFRGRIDGQIKLRGFRIELGEIESFLAGHPDVSVAVATVREDVPGDRRLIAYIVPGANPPDVDELRRLLREKLPAFMVPSAFVTLDALPMTANGKLDRQALPPPEGARPDLTYTYSAPETPVQKSLASIWCEVLVLDRVGIHDDFFDLGGHSLLAARVFSEIERKLGVRIPLVALFQSATIAHLAEIVERDLSTERPTWNSVVQIQRGDQGSPFFLIPWLDGELLGYRDLLEHFPDDMPLYGLMAPGVDGRRVPLRTIESMASHYLNEIRRVQPQGPYYFGGFCFAGVVAYEMGRQLIERGEEPGMVALIDAYWHGSRRPSRLDLEREKWAAYRQADLGGKLVWVRGRLVRLRNRVRNELYERSGALALDVLARSRRLHPPARPWDLMLIAGTRAAKRYAPKPSDVRLHFFRAQLAPGEEATPWERLAGGGVALHPVIGPEITHVTILKEQGAPTLAREIARALKELEDDGPVQAASKREI